MQGTPGPAGPRGPRGPAGPPGPAAAGPTLDRNTQEKLFETLLDATTKSVERARASGQYVQGAAAAVGTLYTAVLALVFTAKDNPLPFRGLLPTFFLGLAVVLAAFYVAFLTQPRGTAGPRFGSFTADEARMIIRADFFVRWSNRMVAERQEFIRGAVMSLAIGVVLLPVGFIDLPATDPTPVADSAATSQVAIATPSPVPTPWPTPEFVSPPEVAAVLYQAQLDEFTGQDGEAAAEADDLGLTVGLGIVGLVAVGLVGWWAQLNQFRRT